MRDPLIIWSLGCFILGSVLGAAALAPDAAILELDPWRPATFVPVVAAGFHEVHQRFRDWVEPALTHLRDVLQRTKLREALPE